MNHKHVVRHLNNCLSSHGVLKNNRRWDILFIGLPFGGLFHPRKEVALMSDYDFTGHYCSDFPVQTQEEIKQKPPT
ncbi:hypothetical protein FACS1894127_4500 [Clostridia bacterium]|nr:hypothetical protein FACS1894127_4500 [Clostridia bacterium]